MAYPLEGSSHIEDKTCTDYDVADLSEDISLFFVIVASCALAVAIAASIVTERSFGKDDSIERDRSIATAMYDQDYDKIATLLRKDETIANKCLRKIQHRTLSMTGLEYSVFLGDGKMALLFFLRGADPFNNAFTGDIEGDTLLFQDQVVPNYYGRGPHPGFQGLYALLQPGNPNNHAMKKYLWLMEKYYWGEIGVVRNQRLLTLKTVSSAFNFIGAESEWRCTLLNHLCVTSICLHQTAVNATGQYLPPDVMSIIIEFSRDDIVISCIWSSLYSLVQEYI